MPVHHDRPDLACDLAALGRQVQVDHAAVFGAAFAPQQLLVLQAIQHPRHGREADLAHAREPGDRIGALQPQHENRFPLHAGQLERLHVPVDAADQRTQDELDLAADGPLHVILRRQHRISGFAQAGGGRGHGDSSGGLGDPQLSLTMQ